MNGKKTIVCRLIDAGQTLEIVQQSQGFKNTRTDSVVIPTSEVLKVLKEAIK